MVFNKAVLATALLATTTEAKNAIRRTQEAEVEYSCEGGTPVLSCFRDTKNIVQVGETTSNYVNCDGSNCICSDDCAGDGCLAEVDLTLLGDIEGGGEEAFLIEAHDGVSEVQFTTEGDGENIIVEGDGDNLFEYDGYAHVDHLDLCLNVEEAIHPNNTGGGFGDPHLKTWSGEVYDFHGACDLVLAKSSVFGAGLGFEIQIRTEMVYDWSYIAATAIKIGDDVLEVQSKAKYVLNGDENAELPATLSGFPVTLKDHGDKRHLFEIDLGEMGSVTVKVFGDFLAVSVHKARFADFRDSVGLMGSFGKGKLLGRDKTLFQDTNLFGLEWQVQDNEPMLFKERKGPQFPQVCNMPAAKAINRRRLAENSLISMADAEKACAAWPFEARESCIYDVLSTGDLAMAEAGAF